MNKFLFTLTLLAAAGGAVAGQGSDKKDKDKGGAPVAETQPVDDKFSFANVDTTDVLLNGKGASLFANTGANINNGKNVPAELAQPDAGSWEIFGGSSNKSGNGKSTVGGAELTWQYFVQDKGDNKATKASGTWSITSNKSIQLDLALGVHASNATGVWMFDELILTAGQKYDGSFVVDWTKNGNSPGYSNFSLFARDVGALPSISPVPEPETYAMILAALGIVGVAKRRKQAA